MKTEIKTESPLTSVALSALRREMEYHRPLRPAMSISCITLKALLDEVEASRKMLKAEIREAESRPQ